MSATIDRRLAARRRSVTEDGARRRLRRVLAVLFLTAAGGLAAWLLYQSPYLAVAEITVDGQDRSRAAEILAEAGVVEGVPTIKLDQASIEAALLTDPWIASVSVRVTWPGSVAVEVLERVPTAWVKTSEAWMLASKSGNVLAVGPEPTAGMATVSVGSDALHPGAELEPLAAAALEFVAALEDQGVGAVTVAGGDEDLSAMVGGHPVLLGYPSDMAAKAEAVAALMRSGVPSGAEISVVSPERPAVKLQPEVETSGEIIGESQPPG